MYNIIKNYKNLENHELQGKIVAVERLEKRLFTFQFYKSVENHLENFHNYCPILQKHFVIENLLNEELFNEELVNKINKELGLKAFNIFIDQKQLFKLMNFDIKISEAFWKDFLKMTFIKSSQMKLKKIFFRSEMDFFFSLFLRRISYSIINNFRGWLYNCDVLNLTFLIKKHSLFMTNYLKQFIFINKKKKFFFYPVFIFKNFTGISCHINTISNEKNALFIPNKYLLKSKNSLKNFFFKIFRQFFFKNFGKWIILKINFSNIKILKYFGNISKSKKNFYTNFLNFEFQKYVQKLFKKNIKKSKKKKNFNKNIKFYKK